MRTYRTRWVVVAFLVLGLVVALVLLVRDLRDTDVPEETGTSPAVAVGQARSILRENS